MLGQLPIERVTPDPVFDKVSVNYTGTVLTKYRYVRKPTIMKVYVCIFVSLTVKAVHLELVSDLTSDASLPVSGDLLLAMAVLLSFGATGGPIMLELHVTLRNSTVSCEVKRPSG